MNQLLSEEELQQLGDKIDPELANILLEIDKSARLVEQDGTSYRHMPDWFRARGKLVAYINSQKLAYREMGIDQLLKTWNSHLGDMPDKEKDKLGYIELTGTLWGIALATKEITNLNTKDIAQEINDHNRERLENYRLTITEYPG